MNLKYCLFLFICFFFGFCKEKNKPLPVSTDQNKIRCTDLLCRGVYTGAEFVNGSDIAHQFSNQMSAAVGDKLKELYDQKKFSKVDLSGILMTTDGMGSGQVTYELIVPFVRVQESCDAFTSFDHVGGWNHSPELEKRKLQLKKALLKGDHLDIGPLNKTKEGLEEYWIQWRNKEKQKECLGKE